MKILILGAGYAGLTAAYKLRKFTDFDISIISKSRIVKENTIFPALLTDDVKIEDTEFDAYKEASKRKINFVEADINGIFPESNEIKTSVGKFDYDILFIALGGAYEENFSKIPGHEFAFMHHTLEGFLGLKNALDKMEDGVRVFVGNSQNSPIEGPSYQVALIAEYLMRKKGIKGEVYLSTQSPKGVFGPIPETWISEAANKYFEKRGIKILKGKSVKEIRKDKVIFSDNTEIYADIKSVLPTLSAPDIVKSANLTDSSNFINVSIPTFKHINFKNIFGLGDSAKSMVPSKTARGAMISAENAVSTLLHEVKGIDLPYYSQGILCMMIGGDDGGILRFDKNNNTTKIILDFGKIYLNAKKLYSRFLVNRAFDVSYHAALSFNYSFK
ncbi:NAD(P)/FAD-dependent oxidoreductase [Acidianus brierleyi]|uniref:Pyridine nucleotide-disulfide oxidoreductase n=1 Tax=Acidianus brierleyi TaxID=41673 RepID=A0A2U9IBS6_9CREN|nr:FAD-dependent oxidoreductase [Acidianus brierleyi]AWR93453.1 pyridine nucleotide-disulfide oxidoreductase [Acidianus brierleyi]